MKKHLIGWGVILILLGVLFAFFVSIPLGILVGIVGVVNFIVRHKAMYLVNGILGIIASIIFMLVFGDPDSWYRYLIGVLGIVWSVRDIWKFITGSVEQETNKLV